MRKLTMSDVMSLDDYERARDRLRREVIELKGRRRVALGERVSLVFENRRTALSQVQEMIRAERIVDPEKIRFEIDTYNVLIPEIGELSATLFIEITQAADVRRELDGFLGLDGPETVFFQIEGAARVNGRFETGHSTEERISAVHYVKFPFDEVQRLAFLEGRGPVTLAVEHPHYRARTVLADRVREALGEDLRS